jgi:hypothetical protein
MQSPAYSIAQSHIEDLRRAAAASALRAEARRTAVEGFSTRPARRDIVLSAASLRRMVARFAV